MRFSPVWPVPIEAARALAPDTIRERLFWLEARGVAFRQTALVMIVHDRLVATIEFVAAADDGVQALRFQTEVVARENAG